MNPERRQERIEELFHEQGELKLELDYLQGTPNADDHTYAEVFRVERALDEVAEELLQLDAPLNSDERAELAELLDEERDFGQQHDDDL